MEVIFALGKRLFSRISPIFHGEFSGTPYHRGAPRHRRPPPADVAGAVVGRDERLLRVREAGEPVPTEALLAVELAPLLHGVRVGGRPFHRGRRGARTASVGGGARSGLRLRWRVSAATRFWRRRLPDGSASRELRYVDRLPIDVEAGQGDAAVGGG